MQLDPQMLAVMKKRGTLTCESDELTTLSIEEMRGAYNAERAWWNEIKPDMHDVFELTIPGPVREVPVRIYRPLNASDGPTLLYLHGGCLLYTSPSPRDRSLSRMPSSA